MLEKYEDLLYNVKAPEYECISFDIFDTLIYRPFLRPTDLFYFLDKKFEEYFPACGISFHRIRIDGEAGARRCLCHGEEKLEDITLTEIYDYISAIYGLEPEVCREIMELEKQLEIKYTFPRKAMKKVYDAAVSAGKKIIFVSDMYLERAAMEQILCKNGYAYFDELFLSSEERALKNTGSLYQVVLDRIKLAPDRIFHIGDNWESDNVMAGKIGIVAAHFPKALDVFFNKDGQFQTGRSGDIVKGVCNGVIDYEKVEQSVGYGCMIALIANMYFDNPFREYKENSVFNGDSYLVGYYAVGMHLAGLMQWLEKVIVQGKYKSIVFTSRDGWLPMQAYLLYRQIKPNLPQPSYVYVSRKALMSVILENRIDFYNLPIDMDNYSPKKVFQLLSFCCEEKDELCFMKKCMEEGIGYRECFANADELCRTMSIFLDNCYNAEMHEKAKKTAAEYLSQIEDHSVLFDMGYSGRIHYSVCKATGKKLDAVFIHSDVEKHYQLARRGNFKIYNFYDEIPWMSDFVREYMLSEIGPSCIGYKRGADGVTPVFEKFEYDKGTYRAAELIQHGAIDFLKCLYSLFCDDFLYFTFKSHEVSLPLEGFLRYASEEDLKMFGEVKFDDAVYGGEKEMNMERMIRDRLKWLPDYAKESNWDQKLR